MPNLNSGRLLGVSWCSTVDSAGAERDVAFGWTSRQARRRCLRKLHHRMSSEASAC